MWGWRMRACIGLLNTAQQLGGAIGLAVLSTLAANTTANTLSGLGHAPSPADGVGALVSGFHVAFLVGAFMMLAGAAILATTVRRGDVARIDDANEQSSRRSRPSNSIAG